MPRLSLLDFGFLITETTESPKHVAALMLFELPADAPPSFTEDLVQQYLTSEVGAPFNQRVKSPLFGLPETVRDQKLDLEYHVRHSGLPKPGTMDQLLHLVSRLHSRRLDRNRPLWEFHVIEGVEGGRFALYIKMHHALIDGASAVRKMAACLSDSAEDRTLRPFWVEEPGSHKKRRRRGPPPGPAQKLLKLASMVGDQAKAVPELYGSFLKGGLEQLGVREGSAMPLPFTAPRTPLNVPVTAARRTAVTTLSLARVKAVAEAADATVNDVLLSVADGALERYLERGSAAPDRPLICQMPMSVRREGDTRVGNQITIVLVKMADPSSSPLRRLQQIRGSTSAVKEEVRGMSREAVTDLMLVTQGMAEAVEKLKLADTLLPLANFLVSNVPGPKEPLYLAGAPLLAVYPLSTLPPGLSVNFTIHTYMGNMDVGIISDRDAIPDLDVIPGLMQEVFEQLETETKALAAKADKPKAKPRSRTRKTTKATAAKDEGDRQSAA